MKEKIYVLITENGNSRQSFDTRKEAQKKAKGIKDAQIVVHKKRHIKY